MKEERYGYSKEEYKLFFTNAVIFLLFFSFLYACMYCTRTNLSSVSAVMIDELNYTKAQFGILSSVMFWSYGIGQLINGRFCEMFGPRRFLVFSALASIVCNLLFSFATNLIVMGIIWGINGYVQAMAWPSGMSMLSKWWPGDRRGFATGFALACSGFGQVLTTLSVVLGLKLFPDMSWRSAFIIPCIFPFVCVVCFWFIVKPYPDRIGLNEYEEENSEKAEKEKEMRFLISEKGRFFPYLYMLKNPKFDIWIFVACLQGLIRYGLVSWIPLYYVENFGIDVTAGLIQSLALPLGMAFGTLIVPTLTDKYCPNNRLLAAVISGIVAAGCIFGFSTLNPNILREMVTIEILLFVAGFAIYAVTGCVWAFSTDIGGRLFSGTSAGILNFAQYIGAAIQSIVYGFIIDNIGWHRLFFSVSAFCLLEVLIGVYTTVKERRAR